MTQRNTSRESSCAPGESAASPAVVWHQCTADEACSRLDTSRDGLTAAQVARRQAQHGPNVFDEAPPRSPFAILAAQFADFMVLILIGAAVVSGLIGDFTDTVVIATIVVLNAVLGFVQEFRAERAMVSRNRIANSSARE